MRLRQFAILVCVALAVRTVSRATSHWPAGARGRPALSLSGAGPFGVFIDSRGMSDGALDASLARASALGFRTVRTVLDWSEAEPARGRYNFARFDHFVRAARKLGLQPMMSISYSPAWAAGYGGDSPNVRARMMPNNLSDWSKFVSTAVSRYKRYVRFWQIWQSPSLDNFRGTDYDYATLLVAAHAAAKKADPGAVILASDPGGPDLGFIAALFHPRTIGAFEGIALAPALDTPEQLAEYLNAIRSKIMPPGAQKLLFITDWGYPMAVGGGAQAAFAARAYLIALAGRVDKIFWTGPLNTPAASTLGDFLSGVDPRGGYSLYRLDNSPVRLLTFRGRDGQNRAMLWSTEAATPFSFDGSAAGVSIRSLVSEQYSPAPAGGVQLTGDPILVKNLQTIPSSFHQTGDWYDDGGISGPVCLSYAMSGEIEKGIYSRKYREWRDADPQIVMEFGSPSVDLDTQNEPFVYGDVDDRYIFFNQGESKILVTVTAAAAEQGKKAGFNIMYDSPRGYVFSHWVSVSPGGWANYKIELNDANFANKGGFDFRLSDIGSDQDVYVSRICVQK